MYTSFNLLDPMHVTSITSLFSYCYNKGYHYRGEIHDFWEIIFIKHGNVSVCIDENLYQLEEGNLLLISPNKFHNFICDKNSASVIIISFNAIGQIPNNTLFNLDNQMSTTIKEIYLQGTQIFSFNGIQIIDTKEKDLLNLKKFKTNLELFLLNLYNNTMDYTTKQFISYKTTLYSKIINILNDNINEKLYLDKIAILCNTSVSNIKSTFKYFTNDSIINYFTKMKIQKSKDLLLKGLSIKETSANLGYTEQNYFSNVFKKIVGVSPKIWLLNNKINNDNNI